MDVDSEAPAEDFHPSSLLQVVVKKEDDQACDIKIENDSDCDSVSTTEQPTVSSPADSPMLLAKPVILHNNQSDNLSTTLVTPQNVEQSQKEAQIMEKKGYWRTCCLCKSREAGGKDSPIAYHKFPADERQCKKWKKFCKMSDTHDVTYAKVCSKHFKEDDYVDSRAKQLGSLMKLRPGAVPSVLPTTTWNPQRQYILLAATQKINPSVPAVTRPRTTTPLHVAVKQPNGSLMIRKENIVPANSKKGTEESSNMFSAENRQETEKKDEPIQYWRSCFLCSFKEPGGKNSAVAFHKFPADPSACKLWKQVCNLTDRDDVSSLKLCSKHFHPQDYIDSRAKQLGGLLKLKPGTVPSVGVPNPLSAIGAPTKYFIVSNSSPRTAIINDILSPTKLLNALLQRDPVTSAPDKSGNMPVRTVPNHSKSAGNRKPGQKVLLKRQYAAGGSSWVQQVPSSKVVSRSPKVISQRKIRMKQPQVLLRRLSMSDIHKFQKGLLTEEQLSCTVQKKIHPRKPDVEISKERRGRRWWRHCYLCNMEEGSDKTVALHKFPLDPDVRLQWKSACDLYEEDNVSSLRLCSRHFKPNDFNAKEHGGPPKVKPSAIPSVDVPNPSRMTSVSRGSVETEYSDEFLPSNLLEVIVNETSPASSIPEDVEIREHFLTPSVTPTSSYKLDPRNTRSCFLCDFKEESGVQSTVAMHKFPDNKNINRLWKKVCNINDHDYMNSSSLFICSNHFVAEDYIDGARRSGSLPILKPGAVPSLSVPNPQISMSLSTIESIEPNPVERDPLAPDPLQQSDAINPANLMKTTFQETNKSGIILKRLFNLDVDKFKTTDNMGGLIPSQNIMQSNLNPKEIILEPNQHLNTSQSNTSSKSAPKLTHIVISSKPPASIPQKTNSFSAISTAKTQSTPTISKQLLQGVENVAGTKSVILGNSVNLSQSLGQTLQFVCNPQQMVNSSGQRIQLMPPLKLAVAPPGYLFPNQNLKKAANVVDNTCQTVDPVESVEQSCQTDEVEDDMEEVDEDLDSDVSAPPVSKKRRNSLPSFEASSPGPSTSKKTGNKTTLKRQSHSQALELHRRRIKKLINSLEDLLSHLQKRDLLSKDASDVLMSVVSGECQEAISKRLRIKGMGSWCPSLKSFALTLHVFSVDAYKYVRHLWPNVVPDICVLKSWFTLENAQPGFTKEVFDAIQHRRKSKKEWSLCNITISEMPIQQQMLYEDKRFYGGINLGTGQDLKSDSAFVAQNVLIFFATALDGSWKAPLGYFLIRSLNSKERANLLVKCLELLHEVSTKVLSITVDGAPAHTNMFIHLGANFSTGEEFQPWFFNPVTREKLFVFWDPCCMMKLVRDALGDIGALIDPKCKLISWFYIKGLCNVQTENVWKLEAKVSKAHGNYNENRTDLRLAVQTFSQRMYNDFVNAANCSSNILKGSLPTAQFCSKFNSIFDMLNCRNDLSIKEHQIAISDESAVYLKQTASEFIAYIRSLRDHLKVPVLKGPRKTGFLGLLICLTNIFELYDSARPLGLKQLFSQKLSLDNVRTFISAIQKARDDDRLLNAKEFENMYRKLVLKTGISFENSDCLADAIGVLHVSSQKENYMDPICDYKDLTTVDQDYFGAVSSLRPVCGDVLKYIGGFVVNKILRKRLCLVCAGHLTEAPGHLLMEVLRNINQGRYVAPSRDVCRICKMAETVLRENTGSISQHITLKFLVTKTFNRISSFVFNTKAMNVHILDHGSFDNHLTQLCKLVIETYLAMRLFQENVGGGTSSNLG